MNAPAHDDRVDAGKMLFLSDLLYARMQYAAHACPFAIHTIPASCLLDDPTGRHCPYTQYPMKPCHLDEIGDGQAWRSIVALLPGLAERNAALLEEALTAQSSAAVARLISTDLDILDLYRAVNQPYTRNV